MESFVGKSSNNGVFGVVGDGDWVPTTRMVDVFPVPQGPDRVLDSLDPRSSIPTVGRHPIRPKTDGLKLLPEEEFQSIFHEPLDLTGVGSTSDHHLNGGPGTTGPAAVELPVDIEFADLEWSPLKVCEIGLNICNKSVTLLT